MVLANSLIATGPLEDIIETAIYTGHLAETIPVSVMLIGPSGAGKSKMLLKFKGAMLHRSDDLTSSGIQDIILDDEKTQTVTHIVIPDFNAPLSHKPSTSTLLVANLLTVMSDGTAQIDDGRERKTLTHNPIGILTAVTDDMYAKNEFKWKLLGFKRRFLPLFYDYSTSSVVRVQSNIRKGKVSSLPLTLRKIVFKGPKKNVALNTREARDIEQLSIILAELLAMHSKMSRLEGNKIKYDIVPGRSLLPYSPHLLLQALAKGNALKNGHGQVRRSDVQFCEEALEFCRYGEPKRL